jgi:hypothetical protein
LNKSSQKAIFYNVAQHTITVSFAILFTVETIPISDSVNQVLIKSFDEVKEFHDQFIQKVSQSLEVVGFIWLKRRMKV